MLIFMIKNICGIDVLVNRKKVRNIRIKVDGDGVVSLTIPNGCSEKTAIDFFLSKIEWVKSKTSKKPRKEIFKFNSGEIFYLFGEPIEIVVNLALKRNVKLVNNKLIVECKTGAEEEIKTLMFKWLTIVLTQKAEQYFSKWNFITKLNHTKLTIRKTISKWGSCNHDTREINLSLYLIHLPEFCLEYVIVHELCHIEYNNHSKDFYRLLEQYIPEYSKIRKWMRENSHKYTIKLK